MGNYDIKRAFIAGATVRAEFPMYSVQMCLPRGPAGDVAYQIWVQQCPPAGDGNRSWHPNFDMVLFLLFLGEMVVRP